MTEKEYSMNKENNRLKSYIASFERDALKMQNELQSAANNRRFMQIARPARTCLNLLKPYIKIKECKHP